MSELWYGFDFDGTLAIEDYSNLNICGTATPILELMRRYINEGKKVKIFTARTPEYRGDIYAFLERNNLKDIEITSTKDGGLVKFYDDRGVGVIKNRGIPHDLIFWNILIRVEDFQKTGSQIALNEIKNMCNDVLTSIGT